MRFWLSAARLINPTLSMSRNHNNSCVIKLFSYLSKSLPIELRRFNAKQLLDAANFRRPTQNTLINNCIVATSHLHICLVQPATRNNKPNENKQNQQRMGNISKIDLLIHLAAVEFSRKPILCKLNLLCTIWIFERCHLLNVCYLILDKNQAKETGRLIAKNSFNVTHTCSTNKPINMLHT